MRNAAAVGTALTFGDFFVNFLKIDAIVLPLYLVSESVVRFRRATIHGRRRSERCTLVSLSQRKKYHLQPRKKERMNCMRSNVGAVLACSRQGHANSATGCENGGMRAN